MIRWPVVRKIVVAVVWVLPFAAFVPSDLSAQAIAPRSVGHPGAFLNSLNTYAQRADDFEGDLNYARVLVGMMSPHVSRDDLAQLARRLAAADQAARHDPRKYIPETSVAAAFNGLMAPVQTNNATPFHADAQAVHSIRGILVGNSPALTSVKSLFTIFAPDQPWSSR